MTTSNLEILAYEPSPLGVLCLRRRELLSEPGTVITEITLDHVLLMSSHNTASEQALANVALEMHSGRDLEVLVGGLGLGHTAYEALRCDRVGRLEVVELLPQVIDWLDRGLVPLAEAIKADARFAVRPGDVYARLAGLPTERHDLILVDVDHSPDEPLDAGNRSFYTEAGLVAAKRHLAPDGVLGVWSYAKSSPFGEAMRRVFHEVRVERVVFENRLTDETETNWLFFGRDGGSAA